MFYLPAFCIKTLLFTNLLKEQTLLLLNHNTPRSICIEDQLSQYLPQLVQIESALCECGILGHMRRDKELWKPVFANGNCFTIAANEFLDQIIVNFSESQLRRDAEFKTYKFFSDVIKSMDNEVPFCFSFQTENTVNQEAFTTNLK